jgi:mRNA-degrading endonuclease YafQ of YafQ-DinJ toxin-antitoxin module
MAVEKEVIFVKNPFNPQLKTHKLKGKLKGLWSFSVTYSFRIVFEFINDDEVIFYDIGDHKIYQ